MPDLPLFRVAAIAALILINAFFVAAEFALVSLRRTRVQQLIEEHRAGARTLARLQDNLNEFLTAVQLGVTLASLTLGWLGEPFVARFLQPWLSVLPQAQLYAGLVAGAVAFCAITYLAMLFGELVPKSLALRKGEQLALAIAAPMDMFMRSTRPAIRLMNASASMVLRLFRLSPVSERSVHSPEELKLIATATRRMGLLPETQEAIIHRVLDLDDIAVREIMTPRQKIFSLPSDMTLAEANARITEIQRSRIPIYDAQLGPEHIVGVVYAKDLARLMHFHGGMRAWAAKAPEDGMRLRQLMHEVLVIPETKAVADLLTEFQARRRHLAIVVDEFGSVTGLVTVEDVLEQIVGEMEDEFDVRDSSILSLGPGTFIFDGNVTLRDLETQMAWHLRHTDGVETLAGFLLVHLQKIPETGDAVVQDGRKFTIMAMDGRRISRVRVEPEAVMNRPAPAISSEAPTDSGRPTSE